VRERKREMEGKGMRFRNGGERERERGKERGTERRQEID
jgi:hypothetical protein